MKIAIALATLTLFYPDDATAKRATRIVADYTPWSAEVSAAVDEFNLVFSPTAPRLVYRQMSGHCPAVGSVRNGTIAICAHDDPVSYAGGPDFPTYISAAHPDDPTYIDYALCHELMHVIAGVGDRFHLNPDGSVVGTLDPGSCVWGITLRAPGPTDVLLLSRAFLLKHDKHKCKKGGR